VKTLPVVIISNLCQAGIIITRAQSKINILLCKIRSLKTAGKRCSSNALTFPCHDGFNLRTRNLYITQKKKCSVRCRAS